MEGFLEINTKQFFGLFASFKAITTLLKKFGCLYDNLDTLM